MIHLICLRCNRANASEAKFCSECGAGLLRKFCSRCRAINDAESHFCQSCGEALPAQPSVTHAAPTLPPAIVPDLTDVYAESDEEPSPTMASSAPDSRWHAEPPAGVPVVVTEPPRTAPAAAMASQRAVLFGFVGGAALLLAMLLWSRSEHPSAPAVEAPASAAPAIAMPATAPSIVAMPAPAQPPLSTASDSAPRANAAGSAIAAVRPAPAKEASSPQARRLASEAQIATQPPAAGPAPRSASVEARPTVRRAQPASPPPECTPQVDALGLCAPGANVADRSGSR